jgi:hypothetical protein
MPCPFSFEIGQGIFFQTGSNPSMKGHTKVSETSPTLARSLFYAVEVPAGSDEKLAIGDRWRRAEVFRFIRQSIDSKRFERAGSSQHVNVAGSSDEVDLLVSCDR